MITTLYRCSDGHEFTSELQAVQHDHERFKAWSRRAVIIPDRVRSALDNTERDTHHHFTDREMFDRCLRLLFDAGVDPMTGECQ